MAAQKLNDSTDNAVETNWLYRIWNNQEIRINNKPVFYKRYFNYGIQTVGDLRFDLNNIDSYELHCNCKTHTEDELSGMDRSSPLCSTRSKDSLS